MKINPHLNLALCLLIFFFSKPTLQTSDSPLDPNFKLTNAYIALQAWKMAITDDPKGFTSNWNGPNVCSYTGVYCAPAPDNPQITTVAGIDLNHANIAGTLPEALGLLKDLALFHINSNRFCGSLPMSFSHLKLLFELDVSNNLFSGNFPSVVLDLPSLKYLDIRYNEFCGPVPSSLFDLQLDALFINNNKFTSFLPQNIGNSPVSVLVLANNDIQGCLPPGIAKMSKTLNEIILSNIGLFGCLPQELGLLQELNVFDVSFNYLVGNLPESIGDLKNLEQLNVAYNKLSGKIPESICSLPRLQNFTFSNNYFSGEPSNCLSLEAKDDSRNCIPGRPAQRPVQECQAFFATHPVVYCGAFLGCSAGTSLHLPPPYDFHHHP